MERSRQWLGRPSSQCTRSTGFFRSPEGQQHRETRQEVGEYSRRGQPVRDRLAGRFRQARPHCLHSDRPRRQRPAAANTVLLGHPRPDAGGFPPDGNRRHLASDRRCPVALRYQGAGQHPQDQRNGDSELGQRRWRRQVAGAPRGGFNPPERRVRAAGPDANVPFYTKPEYVCDVTTVRLPSSTRLSNGHPRPALTQSYLGGATSARGSCAMGRSA